MSVGLVDISVKPAVFPVDIARELGMEERVVMRGVEYHPLVLGTTLHHEL